MTTSKIYKRSLILFVCLSFLITSTITFFVPYDNLIKKIFSLFNRALSSKPNCQQLNQCVVKVNSISGAENMRTTIDSINNDLYCIIKAKKKPTTKSDYKCVDTKTTDLTKYYFPNKILFKNDRINILLTAYYHYVHYFYDFNKSTKNFNDYLRFVSQVPNKYSENNRENPLKRLFLYLEIFNDVFDKLNYKTNLIRSNLYAVYNVGKNSLLLKNKSFMITTRLLTPFPMIFSNDASRPDKYLSNKSNQSNYAKFVIINASKCELREFEFEKPKYPENYSAHEKTYIIKQNSFFKIVGYKKENDIDTFILECRITFDNSNVLSSIFTNKYS